MVNLLSCDDLKITNEIFAVIAIKAYIDQRDLIPEIQKKSLESSDLAGQPSKEEKKEVKKVDKKEEKKEGKKKEEKKKEEKKKELIDDRKNDELIFEESPYKEINEKMKLNDLE